MSAWWMVGGVGAWWVGVGMVGGRWNRGMVVGVCSGGIEVVGGVGA